MIKKNILTILYAVSLTLIENKCIHFFLLFTHITFTHLVLSFFFNYVTGVSLLNKWMLNASKRIYT